MMMLGSVRGWLWGERKGGGSGGRKYLSPGSKARHHDNRRSSNNKVAFTQRFRSPCARSSRHSLAAVQFCLTASQRNAGSVGRLDLAVLVCRFLACLRHYRSQDAPELLSLKCLVAVGMHKLFKSVVHNDTSAFELFKERAVIECPPQERHNRLCTYSVFLWPTSSP